MKKASFEISPRVGPGNGESHSTAPAVLCPNVYVGDKNCFDVRGPASTEVVPKAGGIACTPALGLSADVQAMSSVCGGDASTSVSVLDACALEFSAEARSHSQGGVPATLVAQPRVLLERIDVGRTNCNESQVPMCVEEESAASSDCSLRTVGSGTTGRFWEGRKRRQEPELSESSGGESNPESQPRRRGRPPTTGEYVGLYQAKAQLMAQKREEMRLQAEEELQATVAQYQKARKAPVSKSVVELSTKTAAELHDQIQQEVELIGTVVKKSRNLKSDLVRDMRIALATIAGATAEVMSRTTDDETRRLRLQNANLQADLSAIRTEMNSLREEMGRLRAQTAASSPMEEAGESATPNAPKKRRIEPQTAPSLEEICRRVTITVGDMVNARLAALEGRLLPEKTFRPPLASDSRMPAQAAPEPDLRPHAPAPAAKASAPKVPGEKPKTAKKNTKGKTTEKSVFVPAPPPPPLTEEWTEVVQKGSKKGPKPQKPQKPQPQQQQQTEWQQQGQKKSKRKRARKLRTPRSAAIVITLSPEAEAKGVKYGQVIAEAKRSISLADFGISGLRIKKTATGARLMEVAGANNAERADSLAAKLRECLGDEAVRVHRPMRTAEMRVSGLDDSATVEEVSAAIAKVGGCPVEQVQTGAITVGVGGLGSVWLRCPVAVARKVVDGGRLLVGWVSAQVKLLEARTQRCYRCLEEGHMRVACKAEVDRSDECYRCGATGHKARGCTAPVHCKACSAAGKPANHRAGGKLCTPAPKKSSKSSAGGPRAGKQNSRPTASRAEPAEKMSVG